MKKQKVKLNDMDLFQQIKVGEGMYMTKVPGGWIYSEYIDLVYKACQFIPRHHEVGDEEYEVEND